MTKKTKALVHMNEKVTVEFARYGNMRTAIQLNTLDGEPWATATVNLVDEEPAEGCVFIKDYSENEGMLQWLVDNKIVEATGRKIPTGFVVVPEACLLEPWLSEAGGKTS